MIEKGKISSFQKVYYSLNATIFCFQTVGRKLL